MTVDPKYIPDSVWLPISQASVVEREPPPRIVSGHGATLVADDGVEYLDGLAGIWCVNIGYGRDEMAKTAYEQMKRLAYLSPMMRSDPTSSLAHKLLEMLDMHGHVYFSCSGSEANEVAFKIVWQYHEQSGEELGHRRKRIISRYRAYHGNTLGAISATGQAERKVGYGLQSAHFLHINPPYPYRRMEGLSVEQHGAQMARELEQTIIYEGPQTIGAFIMEPIISGGGVLIPPDNYLPAIREICDKYGVLLIMDEVVSGFGRTGKMFGQEHWNAKPDIVTCAKGIASGYQPLGATIVSEKIYDAFRGEPGDLSHFRHINTYGGHPVATAVALKNIEIIEREGLVDRAREIGQYVLDQFQERLQDNRFVGEVRGRGLLVGIEMVAERENKTPLDPSAVGAVLAKAKRNGVLLGRNGNTVPGLANVLVAAPPLVITKAEADRLVDVTCGGIEALKDA